jgi:hypothetical protein
MNMLGHRLRRLWVSLHPRKAREWTPIAWGALAGLVSTLAVLVPRWLRRPPRLAAKKTTTLELDLSDLLPAAPPPPPSSARASRASIGGAPSLAPPDVHSFEIH